MQLLTLLHCSLECKFIDVSKAKISTYETKSACQHANTFLVSKHMHSLVFTTSDRAKHV